MTPPSTASAQLEQLRRKIAEANSGICQDEHLTHGDLCRHCFRDVMHKGAPERCIRPIRLADVLLALPGPTGIDADGHFLVYDQNGWHLPGKVVGWDLRADSLDAQSPETIAFLHSLLC